VSDKPQNASGVADLSLTQSIVMVDSLQLEVVTPKRIWVFKCNDNKSRNDWANAFAKVTKAQIVQKNLTK